MLIGALEAGGTKMVCALGKEDGTIMNRFYSDHHTGGDDTEDHSILQR